MALLKKTQLLLLACIIIMVAMIVFCACNLFFRQSLDIASAQESGEPFVVKATDFDADTLTALWSVTRGNDVVLEPTRGRWSTGSGDFSASSIKIRDAIRETLKKDGVVGDDYNGVVGTLCTIKFDFEDINATIDVAEGVYKEIGASVKAQVGAITTFSPEVYFEYSKDGEDIIATAKATKTAEGYALPVDLPYGKYNVRLVAKDEINFEEVDDKPKEYTTYRYSEWLECAVKKASINLPSTFSIHATYGTTLDGMNNKLNSEAREYLQTEGKFVASDASNQTEDALKNVQNVGDVILSVRDGSYMVTFEFEPKDESYAKTTVRVAVAIDPKEIVLYVKDSFSLAGDQFVYPSYYLSSPNVLVGDDTIEDLHITFDIVNTTTLEKTDGTTVGKFRSVPISGNANYTIKGYPADTQYWQGGGRYWVYNKMIEYTAEDNVKFFVYVNTDLLDNGTVRIVKMNVDEPLEVAGKTFLCAYRITMFDTFGNEFTPTEDYTICWESNPLGAKWVSAYDGGFDFVEANASVGITLKSGQNAIYFFSGDDVQKGYGLIGAYIAIGIVCVIALLVFIPALRRRLICKNSYKNYVYQQEIDIKSVDCEISTENNTPTKAVKTEAKKQRHGKKNKELNGTKRGDKQ